MSLSRRQFIKSLAGLAVALPVIPLLIPKKAESKCLDLYPAEETPVGSVTFSDARYLSGSDYLNIDHYYMDKDGIMWSVGYNRPGQLNVIPKAS